MGTLNLNISTNKDVSDFRRADDDAGNGRRLISLIKGLASGAIQGTIDVSGSTTAPAAATGTLTLSGALATETAVIGGVTFTASASPSGEAEFDISGDDTADAASLAAKIAAHSTLGAVVTASAASGVVTITALQKGVIGNFITIVGDTGITASGATLSGGTGGAQSAPETIGRS